MAGHPAQGDGRLGEGVQELGAQVRFVFGTYGAGQQVGAEVVRTPGGGAVEQAPDGAQEDMNGEHDGGDSQCGDDVSGGCLAACRG